MDNQNYGIYLDQYCINNEIHRNNFIDNNLGGSSQGFDDGTDNTWYDIITSKGNYWNDWSGSGSYAIDGSANCVDLYPLGSPATYNPIETPIETPTNESNTITELGGIFYLTGTTLVFSIVLFMVIKRKKKQN